MVPKRLQRQYRAARRGDERPARVRPVRRGEGGAEAVRRLAVALLLLAAGVGALVVGVVLVAGLGAGLIVLGALLAGAAFLIDTGGSA